MFSFLFPQKIEEIHSPINGKIVVEKFRGKLSVKVGGLSQSGGLVENLWSEALKNLDINPKNILILGFGSGTLALLLSKKFSHSKITGVDIDKKMIDVGIKYFEINKINNLKIVISDAEEYLSKTNNKFDLIFVDLYLGENFPKKFENDKFIELIYRKLRKLGIVVLNRLYYANHISEAEKFLDKLSKIFKNYNCKNIKYNIVVFAKKI